MDGGRATSFARAVIVARTWSLLFSSFFGWTDRGRRTACVVVVHIDRERKNVRFCLFTVT